MTTSKQYDHLNRLTEIGSTPTASAAVSFSYDYNAANQRIRCRLADGSYWLYQYDALGQLTSAHKYWPDQTPVAGQQFDYSFDTIGNRKSTLAGGNQHGGFQRQADYTVNNLNQYTGRDVPGYLDVMGAALVTSTVTVNGQNAYRKGEYFWDEVNVDNSSLPVWEGITVAATGQTSVTGHRFVPKTPESFSHDADGNLTSDGRWTYTWDGENRLVQMVANTTVGPQELIKFEYDAQGRRIRKEVWDNTAGTGSPTVDKRFVYDGWNLIAVLNSSFSLLNSFLWGNDLSGTPQGAGGVGGLLAVDSSGTNCFVAYDGNGNVAALINATDGTTVANYEYGPFGELLRQTGPLAKANPFRFSTKYQDDESDLLYYGYRYYNPSTGRWLSRDPDVENGGVNLNGFIRNGPLAYIDDTGARTYPNDGKNHINFPSGGYIHQALSAGDTAGNAIDIAAQYFSAGIEQMLVNFYIDQGLKSCAAQAKQKGGCGGCCMIELFLEIGKYDGHRDVVSPGAYYYSKDCSALEAGRSSDGLVGYYGREGYPPDSWWGNWIYKKLHPHALLMRLDNQYDYTRYFNMF